MTIAVPTLPGFVPSPQQAAFFDWGLNGKGNAFVEAVAGAGKTTSLLKFCEILKKTSNRSLSMIIVAYSKKIERELSGKIAKSGWDWKELQAKTFHSYGWGLWRWRAKGCKVNSFKIANIMEELMIEEGYHSFIKTLISLSKNHLLNPSDRDEMMDLVEHHDLTSELDEDHPLKKALDYTKEVFKKSNDQRFEVADFDDMLYLPVKYKCRVGFPFEWVFVDEAQDTNPARRELAAMMLAPGGRIVFMGDRFQAIFGFVGADSASVDIITNAFKCSSLPLTVTYRCPKKVVAEAQRFVNHIIAHDSAPDGEVETIPTMGEFPQHFERLTKNDAILCRKTAPLVELAYTLIRKNIACHVEGKDIGAGLRNLLMKWKKIKSKDAYLNRLNDWERKQIDRLLQKQKEAAADSLRDRCDTIRVISEGCDTVQCMIDKVDNLFGDSDSDDPKEKEKCDNLTLSTVHKSKGREWNNVFIYGFTQWMPSSMAKQAWEKEQERNLQYVAITRAQRKLVFVG